MDQGDDIQNQTRCRQYQQRQKELKEEIEKIRKKYGGNSNLYQNCFKILQYKDDQIIQHLSKIMISPSYFGDQNMAPVRFYIMKHSWLSANPEINVRLFLQLSSEAMAGIMESSTKQNTKRKP